VGGYETFRKQGEDIDLHAFACSMRCFVNEA